jgi:hypothetical protein
MRGIQIRYANTRHEIREVSSISPTFWSTNLQYGRFFTLTVTLLYRMRRARVEQYEHTLTDSKKFPERRFSISTMSKAIVVVLLAVALESGQTLLGLTAMQKPVITRERSPRGDASLHSSERTVRYCCFSARRWQCPFHRQLNLASSAK